VKGCLWVKKKEPQYIVVTGNHNVFNNIELNRLPGAAIF